MARRKRFGQDDGEVIGDELLESPVVETFAEAQGLPANAHAKELAKKESKAKKSGEPSGHFYTLKGADKVIKQIVKLKGVYQVYIGNLKRHRDGLDPQIKKWKQEGLWIEPHAAGEKVEAIRKELAK